MIRGKIQHKSTKNQERDWLVWKKSYLFPKPRKYNQSLTKVCSFIRLFVQALSLCSVHEGPNTGPNTGPSMSPSAAPVRLKYNLGCRHADGKVIHRKVLHLWALVLLGLVRTSSAGLWPQRQDLFHTEMELSHLVMEETTRHLGTVLCFCSNNSYHYTSSSYVWVPKMLFLWLHGRILFLLATEAVWYMGKGSGLGCVSLCFDNSIGNSICPFPHL